MLTEEAEWQDSQNEASKQQQEEFQEDIRDWAADEDLGPTSGASSLHLTDALGRNFVFPFETCRDWVVSVADNRECSIRQLI